MTLPAPGCNRQPLRGRGQRRDRRLPQPGTLSRLREAREVGGYLAELLVVEIPVGHKSRHDSRSFAHGGDELLRGEFVTRQRLGESAFALVSVAKLAIVFQTEVALPDFLARLDVGSLGRRLDLDQEKQKHRHGNLLTSRAAPCPDRARSS
jgi:hypothetical protein